MRNKGALRLVPGQDRAYLYGDFDPDYLSKMSFAAGNFIFGRYLGEDIEIVHVDEGKSVDGAVINTTLWSDAKKRYKADIIFFHPADDPIARAAEKHDLIIRWQPPMNLENRT